MKEFSQKTQKRISDRLVGLIDIVFAVVVGTSIAAIFANNSLQEWPSINEAITLPNMSLLVAYFAIVLSWVGYHRMIELNPYSLDRWGYIRFGMDVVIVFMYTVLIYSRENFSFFLSVFPMIFLLYAFGGMVRAKEYGEEVSWPKGSFMFMGLFAMNWIIYSVWRSLVSEINLESNPIPWIIWFLTLGYLFCYRWEREKKGFVERDENLIGDVH